MKINSILRNSILSLFVLLAAIAQVNAKQPAALTDVYLPDFSYAGYEFGEKQPNTKDWKVIDVKKHGLKANDTTDDTKALQKLLASLKDDDKPVIIQFRAGQYILSEIIKVQRSNIVLRGMGKSETELYFPRPLEYAPFPEELEELAEYLVEFKKVEKRKKQNVHNPYTPWSWSGGFLWTGVEGERIKSYMKKYDKPTKPLAKLISGNKDDFSFNVDDGSKLKKGQVVRINWYNPEGEKGSFLNELYGDLNENIEIGSHHWNFPKMALARQHVLITNVKGNKVTIKTPLLHKANPAWKPDIIAWKHISNIGFEHFSIKFPKHPWVAHHVEAGFNGMFLTRTFNSWVKDITIENSDSGILTENGANITIENVTTLGSDTALAHYAVQIGGVSNVLVKNLQVHNEVIHPLSFNTFSNKNVYLNSTVSVKPAFDQHGGANHENLFDNTTMNITLEAWRLRKQGFYSYPLFKSGGAGYWRPQHGKYNTLWNTKLNFSNGVLAEKPIVLDGMKPAADARIVGVSANLPVKIKYNRTPYLEAINEELHEVPSLYQYQLNKRLNK